MSDSLNKLKMELYKLLEVQQATSVALIEHYFEHAKKINEETAAAAEKQIVVIEDESLSSDRVASVKRSVLVDSEEEDASFVANDESEISSYSSSEMEKLVAENNEKLKKNSKRVVKKAKSFIHEKFKDEDIRGGGIDCGVAEITKNDIRELNFLLESLESFETNFWWKKHFGKVIEGIINNCGKKSHMAEALFKDIVQKISQNKYVRVSLSVFDRPSCICHLCGLKRSCHYDYLVNGDKEKPIGNECYKIVECLIQLFMTLKNEDHHSPEQVLERVFEIRDNLLQAHVDKSNKY